MYFVSDKIGKIQFFHLLVEVARELIMLWLSTLAQKAQYIGSVPKPSDQGFIEPIASA